MTALPKVLVIGKTRSIVHWVENTATAFHETGCQTKIFSLNGEGIWQSWRYKWHKFTHGDATKPVAIDLEHVLHQFQPDLIIFIAIAALYMPEHLFALCREKCPHAALTVWTGDRLSQKEAAFSLHADHVFVTDTGFVNDLRQQGYAVSAGYLPLAVDTNVFAPQNIPRSDTIVFVANRSPMRGAMLEQIQYPVSLYGKGWSQLKNRIHEVHAKRLPWKKLPMVYSHANAVLNIHHDKNVIHGLNQRSFEPCACKTPVLHDDMPDLPRCFEPEKEVLVYRNLDELHDNCQRLSADKTLARTIGEAAWRRVTAEHTWQHRAQHILHHFDLSTHT